jgi:MFS family permease
MPVDPPADPHLDPSVDSRIHPDVGLAAAARARTGVYWVFGVNGAVLASWAARLPAIREDLGLTPSGIGFVLLAVSVGAMTGLPLSGPVVHRLGPARTVTFASILCTAGVAGVGLARDVVTLVPMLFLVGLGNGTWDVAMNVEGAEVERRLNVQIMPRFHAAFSLGTVGGAGLGSVAAALDLPVRQHLPVVAIAVLVAALAATRAFLPGDHVQITTTTTTSTTTTTTTTTTSTPGPDADARAADPPSGSRTLTAWREPRTLLLGVLVLGMGLSEGAANDWIAVGLVDGYRVDHAVAAAGYGCFVAAMTLARYTGPAFLRRVGRVLALRLGASAVLVGVFVFIVGASLVDRVPLALACGVAVVGVLGWGWGVALGFPVGMSAAADQPALAAARVSVVSTIGYTAFLAGPPLLGLLGDRVGVVRSLAGVAVAVVLSLLVAGSARPLAPEE